MAEAPVDSTREQVVAPVKSSVEDGGGWKEELPVNLASHQSTEKGVIRVDEKRPESTSYISMKSDCSMGEPINFKVIQECPQIARPESPTTSTALSDESIDLPIHFKVDEKRPESTSYISMKSDCSMGEPINFKVIQECPQIARPESPTTSTALSDESIDLPIHFKSGNVLCDSCSEFLNTDTQAVKSCQTCSNSYCETHVRLHYTEARFKKHKLVDVPRGLELCEEHRKPLEVFCLTDQMFVCSQCSVTHHQGHNIRHETELPGGKDTGVEEPASVNVLPPPGEISFLSVKTNSVTLSWGCPEGLERPRTFKVAWESDGESKSLELIDMYKVEITGLQPGQKYEFRVATKGDHGKYSKYVSAATHTVVPPPRDITVGRSEETSFDVRWSKAPGMEYVPHYFIITCTSPGTDSLAIHTEVCHTTLTDLQTDKQYTFVVSAVMNNGRRSEPASTTIDTGILAPVKMTVVSVDTTSATVSWEQPDGTDQTQLQYLVSYQSPGTDRHITITSSLSITLSDLRPASEYSVSVCSLLENRKQSGTVSTTTRTKCSLNSYLKTLGLEQSYGKKLTLNETLAINAQMFNPKYGSTPKLQLCFFLRELMKANVSARDKLSFLSDEKDLVNPLDIITALFLCSDHFLQQEIALKMSLCQFAVPLLLPNCETQESTLMLWAMRDMVKRYRTPSMDQKEFVEDSIVLSNLPMVSFVRLGYSSLSKSELLNYVLSKSQQTNRSFVHQNMTGGNTTRQISDGLVEVSWYFPCGNPNIDVFSDPVAVTNLRGDIQDFPTQFEFLCKISAAVFVFCDGFSSDSNVLNSKHMADRQFIVSNTEAKGYDAAAFEHLLQQKPCIHIKKGSQMNNDQLVKKLHDVVTEVVKANPVKFTVEKMAEEAKMFNIHVDEDFKVCQAGKKSACSITDHISDIADFKMKHLPLHDKTLKELVKIEREQSKLKYAGTKDLEKYKDELRQNEEDLRRKQVSQAKVDIISKFIDALKESKGRSFFLKWMKITLDHISRAYPSHLENKFESLCESFPVVQNALSALDNEMYVSSLGTEHFLRELGQLYESAQSLPESHPTRQQYKQLPGICAQLMLDGFPLELIDGDASYIPMKWISGVLTNLHRLTSCNSKVRVITVLGVQSSGKSTLLNTMFGVQFSVSSGRCTRGAFMQLIRVEEDLKKQLDCDFIMVIDTEGLKAPELAQLDNSYEHDNELATLVVGLSDITIINIAMENATEMKDTMQIVVHAFLGMKEVGKKHMCHFVHQNVPDCSAHAKNAKGRKVFLQHLNEMTEVAAKMEKREHNKKFTDIMEYDPEKHSCYLPGLWFGNPPMAPVNAGYSEAVSELKRSIIQRLIDLETPAYSSLQFCEWTKDVWNAVKHENFIFSFRNSLEADAYNMLSVEFNRLDWTFRSIIQGRLRKAEIEISNSDTCGLNTLNSRLKNESMLNLQTELTKMQENLDDYYNKAGKNAKLIERHRDSFLNSAKALHKHMETSVTHKLELAVTSKRSMAKIEELKKTHSSSMEQKVMKLLEDCKSQNIQKNSEELELAFEETWKETVDSLNICKLETQEIDSDILKELRKNMENKGGALKILNKIRRLDDQTSDQWMNNVGNDLELMVSNITEECKRSTESQVKSGLDYNNIYAMDLLHMCDRILDEHQHLKIDVEFEAKLKINIFANASKEYQKMHKAFVEANDPHRSLEELKSKFLVDFNDLFFERDQCEKKAQEFTKVCLEPAVRHHVNDFLGKAIVTIMKHREIEEKEDIDLRTRTLFHFSILKQLLLKDDFKQFISYIGYSYQHFVKGSIVDTIMIFFSQNKSVINDLLKENLNKITTKVEQGIKTVGLEPLLKKGQSISDITACSFIECICSKLRKDLIIPQDGLNSVLRLNKAKGPRFLEHLGNCVKTMKDTLDEEFNKDIDVKAKLEQLRTKPQDEIFDDIIGCGRTCPFCKAPCEAAGRDHKEHFVTIHRPGGIGKCHFIASKKLTTDICSSTVASENNFKCSDTKTEFHPFQGYQSIYPDWSIKPDPRIEASDYWKYVFARYNQQFANEYKFLPADIPDGWRNITKEQAIDSLEKAYRLKSQ